MKWAASLGRWDFRPHVNPEKKGMQIKKTMMLFLGELFSYSAHFYIFQILCNIYFVVKEEKCCFSKGMWLHPTGSAWKPQITSKHVEWWLTCFDKCYRSPAIAIRELQEEDTLCAPEEPTSTEREGSRLHQDLQGRPCKHPASRKASFLRGT